MKEGYQAIRLVFLYSSSIRDLRAENHTRKPEGTSLKGAGAAHLPKGQWRLGPEPRVPPSHRTIADSNDIQTMGLGADYVEFTVANHYLVSRTAPESLQYGGD